MNDLDNMKHLIQLVESAEQLTEATDVIQPETDDPDTVILFSDYTKDHIIKTHSKPGQGSIFSGSPIPTIQKMLTTVTPERGTVSYTKRVSGVGFNLVVTNSEAMRYGNNFITVKKLENGTEVEVPAMQISEPLSSFSTDLLTVILLPTDVGVLNQYHADVKDNKIVLQAIQAGKCFHVATAYPGDTNIPRASDWKGKYVVLIPTNHNNR